MLIVSSFDMSFEERLSLRSPLSPGSGTGEEDANPGGVIDSRDLFEVLDGVLYGVSDGVGKDAAAAALNSSSVSQTAMFAMQLL